MERPLFLTQDFDLAAALSAVGVNLVTDTGEPIAKVFSESHPMRHGIGKRGIQMEENSRDGVPSEALRNAYEDAEADRSLDNAITELPISDAQKEELLRLAQLSAMSYIAHAFRERKALDRIAEKSEGLIEVAKGGRFALVAAKGRSDEVNRKLLQRFG